MNTENRVQLRVLMEQHQLSVEDVAELLNKKIHTIYSWRSVGGNEMSDNDLLLLNLLLKEKT